MGGRKLTHHHCVPGAGPLCRFKQFPELADLIQWTSSARALVDSAVSPLKAATQNRLYLEARADSMRREG
jgi:hypothetical protein